MNRRSEARLVLITSPEVTDTGPGFNRGPGAAPGGVASKNGWVYMRVQGGFDYIA